MAPFLWCPTQFILYMYSGCLSVSVVTPCLVALLGSVCLLEWSSLESFPSIAPTSNALHVPTSEHCTIHCLPCSLCSLDVLQYWQFNWQSKRYRRWVQLYWCGHPCRNDFQIHRYSKLFGVIDLGKICFHKQNAYNQNEFGHFLDVNNIKLLWFQIPP